MHSALSSEFHYSIFIPKQKAKTSFFFLNITDSHAGWYINCNFEKECDLGVVHNDARMM